MSARDRTVISVFIVWHLIAIGTSAVPAPASLAGVSGTARPTDDQISAQVRPLLDTVGAGVERASNALYRGLGFIRPVVSPYIDRLGLTQSWNMFANPPLMSEYLRMRYYIGDATTQGAGPITVATELVFPAAPETGSRLVRSFWQSHQDKAVSNALGAYITGWSRRQQELETTASSHLDGAARTSLLPVVQYFAGRYIATHPTQDGRRAVVLRTEAWYGAAVSRAPDDSNPFARGHAAALSRYESGVPSHPPSLPYPGLGATERESDIAWTLIFVEGR